jgi:pyruvate dehydrogenase E2 component (dihydrolipoamide acetyltransferase)
MDDAYAIIELSPIRRAIAARMAEATRTIPHFRVVADIQVDALLALRAQCRTHESHTRLSINDFLIKAAAGALIEIPTLNVQWAETAIRRYHTADISVVLAVDGGLMTPIVRRANEKSIWEISNEVREFSSRAQRNALKMSEIDGGSFSISNLGMYGVDQFDAIINPPQCAILAIGRARPMVLPMDDGELHKSNVMRLTLSADHRAIDGVAAAQFLSALRARLEQPERLLV